MGLQLVQKRTTLGCRELLLRLDAFDARRSLAMYTVSHPANGFTGANAFAAPALHSVPRWTLIPAALAPISLVVAWFVAGLAQPSHYDPVRQTISVLAGYAASDRWIMTIGLYAVSICQIITAAGLSVVRRARVLLVMGGVAGLGVAIFPQPLHGSGSAHMVFATLSVTLLALWPATLGARGSPRPMVLSTRGSVVVTIAFLGLLAWVFAAAHGGGALGVAERVDTAIANSWPLVIILTIRRSSMCRLADC